MFEYIPFIIALMIFYDLCIHIVHLLKKEDAFIRKKISFWPNFGKGKDFDREYYQMFWTSYWAVAFVLLIVYIMAR